MITLSLFRDLDQKKPIQMLLDTGGMFGATAEWFNVKIHKKKDNVVIFRGREILLNEFQGLRQKPPVPVNWEKRALRAEAKLKKLGVK